MFRENMTRGLGGSTLDRLATGSNKRFNRRSLTCRSDSFGHNGFTGTSVWIDPEHQRIFILLTNRTHAHTLPFANINAVRRQFHSLAVRGLN